MTPLTPTDLSIAADHLEEHGLPACELLRKLAAFDGCQLIINMLRHDVQRMDDRRTLVTYQAPGVNRQRTDYTLTVQCADDGAETGSRPQALVNLGIPRRHLDRHFIEAFAHFFGESFAADITHVAFDGGDRTYRATTHGQEVFKITERAMREYRMSRWPSTTTPQTPPQISFGLGHDGFLGAVQVDPAQPNSDHSVTTLVCSTCRTPINPDSSFACSCPEGHRMNPETGEVRLIRRDNGEPIDIPSRPPEEKYPSLP